MMVEETGERSWHFQQLRWSLQSLAASASDQNPLFRDAAITADALALDFDRWASLVCERYGSELSDVQRASLEAIEQTLTRTSRDGSEFDADLWTEAALKTSEHWASVRRLAVSALHAFGWRAADSTIEPAD